MLVEADVVNCCSIKQHSPSWCCIDDVEVSYPSMLYILHMLHADEYITQHNTALQQAIYPIVASASGGLFLVRAACV
jgi:hypothetical protein